MFIKILILILELNLEKTLEVSADANLANLQIDTFTRIYINSRLFKFVCLYVGQY